MTLLGDFNFGNKLQLYAVSSIWKSFGYAAEQLWYERPKKPLAHPKETAWKLIGNGSALHDERRGKERVSAFNRFNQLIPVRKFDSIAEINSDDYAYFSVGSDQVWNPGYAGVVGGTLRNAWHTVTDPTAYADSLKWYFLGFAEREQRIALAPSLGVDSLDSRQAKWLAEGVSNFKNISIREERGAWLIKECSGREATILCDPTLVITQSEWGRLADDRETPNKPYVLAYLLGEQNKESAEALRLATNGGDLPIVYLSDLSRPGEPDAGPAEFISLVAHACHVVTDSFHASVFSCIFERPLTIVHRDGNGAGMFSRMESLANMLGVQTKIWTPNSYDKSNAADYEGVSDGIARERERFLTYLEGCING